MSGYRPWSNCPGSVMGSHDIDRHGFCYWCLRRVAAPVPAPTSYPVSELTEAYEYFYNPDEQPEIYVTGRDPYA